MDQALEKDYNKPSKSQSGIIGISHRKEAVAKWNIIKQDKSKFATILLTYSLHHEFSRAITDTATHCISLVIDYIWNPKNPCFPTTATWQILLTKPKLTENLFNFWLKVPNWELKCKESSTRAALNRSLQNY